MKRIIFDGYLRDMYPHGIELDCRSPLEAISALRFYPGFRESDGVQHKVILPDYQSLDAIRSPTDATEIRVELMLEGAGGGTGRSMFMLAVGMVLIATGAGAVVGTQMVLGGLMTAATATSMGVMLMLQGAVALMMDAPQSAAGNKDKSDYISAGKNTTKAGTRIPLIFGRCKVSGHFLSVNVTAGNKPVPAAVPPEQEPVSGVSVYDGGPGTAVEVNQFS